MSAWRASLGRTPFAVLDVETTGIFPGWNNRIIEIAVIRFQPTTGEIEDEYVSLVNPKRDIGRADIHGISAGELLHAPEFAEIAGDVGHRLQGAILVGHNLRFDMGFLCAEYERLGVAFPTFPSLCTLHLTFRIRKHMASRSLVDCCEDAGVSHPNPHTAYGDAQATMGLMLSYLSHIVGCALCDLGCDCEEVPDGNWLTVAPSGRAVLRSEAAALRAKERGYLSSLVSRLSGIGSSLREAEYLCLVDRVLEDRALTREEADSLCAAAQAWGMSQNDVKGAHQAYLWALARQAKADGVVTEMERRDLETVCELLGADPETLAAVLDEPGPQPRHQTDVQAPKAQQPGALAGKSVCFTGELLGKVAGGRVTREMAEDYARRAGMLVKPSVSKGLDILVVADPDTQSGKARKAREYGTRIMAEVAFWRAVGLDVE